MTTIWANSTLNQIKCFVKENPVFSSQVFGNSNKEGGAVRLQVPPQQAGYDRYTGLQGG